MQEILSSLLHLSKPCDVFIHGARRHPIELKYLYPPKSEAILDHNVGLWLDGKCKSNLVLANVKGVKEPWAVITDEEPTLQTIWQYGMRFRIEELFLDSKSGVFELEESKIRQPQALERLYLVVALAMHVCHYSWYGSSIKWTQTTSRSSLSTRFELSQNWY